MKVCANLVIPDAVLSQFLGLSYMVRSGKVLP
jgi:hypothetical protein